MGMRKQKHQQIVEIMKKSISTPIHMLSKEMPVVTLENNSLI
jgi:hypothetical protein